MTICFCGILSRVAVPLAVRQFALRRTEDGLLVGYRSWAMVTEAWAGRLRADADAVNAMGREDWRGGEVRVVVDEVGVFEEEGR